MFRKVLNKQFIERLFIICRLLPTVLLLKIELNKRSQLIKFIFIGLLQHAWVLSTYIIDFTAFTIRDYADMRPSMFVLTA